MSLNPRHCIPIVFVKLSIPERNIVAKKPRKQPLVDSEQLVEETPLKLDDGINRTNQVVQEEIKSVSEEVMTDQTLESLEEDFPQIYINAAHMVSQPTVLFTKAYDAGTKIEVSKLVFKGGKEVTISEFFKNGKLESVKIL